MTPTPSDPATVARLLAPPATEYSDADLVTLALEKSGCLARYDTKILFDRVQECRTELLRRLARLTALEAECAKLRERNSKLELNQLAHDAEL